ncbi:MAG: hypothetical protein GF353_28625 [Candidatus Lokiarchaeota archaeon]|nr:hypothetical protein [Candidatus Lokiarchaeota archaeon]MBD3353968.1 hypothetical protein [Candidatus Lokiarchaeota archaeon]
MSVSKAKKGKTNPYVTVGIIATLCIAGYFLGDYLGWWSAGATKSTFNGFSYTDGENVGGFVEVSIWTWDPDKTYNSEEDLRNLNNFEETVSSKDIDDIAIDLTKYEYGVWIEVDPDGDSVFSNNFHWLSTANNIQDYPIYAYHLSSDVNFNILNTTDMAPLVANSADDDNYTATWDFPHYTTANSHSGNDWSIDDSDVDDFTESELQDLYDERQWRCQAPLYVVSDDADDDYSKVFEQYTNVFGFKIVMNTTISTVDGNAAQINITIGDEYGDDWYAQISGTNIFLLCANAKTAPGSLEFELEFADDIKFSNAYSGRIDVTGDITTAAWDSTYSTIAA